MVPVPNPHLKETFGLNSNAIGLFVMPGNTRVHSEIHHILDHIYPDYMCSQSKILQPSLRFERVPVYEKNITLERSAAPTIAHVNDSHIYLKAMQLLRTQVRETLSVRAALSGFGKQLHHRVLPAVHQLSRMFHAAEDHGRKIPAFPVTASRGRSTTRWTWHQRSWAPMTIYSRVERD